MVDFSLEALGRVVRRLREEAGSTQEQLGREAGYQKGAGVSISRLESGALRPGQERLAGIAQALGLDVDGLLDRAAEETSEDNAADPAGATGSDGADEAASGGAGGPRSPKDLKARASRIQAAIDERTTVITSLSEEFNCQHDRARDEFFMKFVEIAERVDGAPQPDPTQLEDENDVAADAVAAYRLKASASGVGQLLAGGAGGAAAGAAVGSAAAYGTFVAASTLGAASTGAAISGLSGVAAMNATLALLGGGTLAAGGSGIAGGTMLLAGIVAAPAAIFLAGGLVLMRKHTRKQQAQLSVQLDETEAQLAATEAGYQALRDILPRATGTLDYVATHAGHALRRWEDRLGTGSLSWDALGEADQQHYQGYIEVAGAQVTIVTLNVQGLLTTEGTELDQLVELADQVLTQSKRTVTAHV